MGMKIELEVKNIFDLLSTLAFAGGALSDEIFSLSYMGSTCIPTTGKFQNKYGYTDEELVKELQYKVDLIQDIMNQIIDKGINNLEKELKDE